ncbi:MAG: PepSY-associated TM helix domain-containing protein [Pseudomonadota bacterium]
MDQTQTKTLVAVHGWSGVTLGLLLYTVVVTGMVAVFAEEIAHWSVGLVQTDSPVVALAEAPGNGLQQTVERFAQEVDESHLEEVSFGQTTLGNLSLFYHRHQTNDEGNVEEFGTQFEIDPVTGAVLNKQVGTGLTLFETDEDRALSRFLVSVHTELHLPRPWGLILTGILGLAMMVAAISGLFIHKHLIKDIFTLRKSDNAVLTIKDTHTVAGTWGLPFAFVLAFTGSFFSFAGSVGLPLMAMVGFGGDQERMIETLVGAQVAEDPTPSQGAPVDAMVLDLIARYSVEPNLGVIEHYGRADAAVTLFAEPQEGDLARGTYLYSGVTGEFQRQKPQVGQTESAGATLLGLMGPLHFGNFLGLFSKAVWAALGFAMCFVTLTGMNMWLARRPGQSMAWLRWGVTIFGYGLPVPILASVVAFFCTFGSGATSFWTPAGFVFGAAFVFLWSALRRVVPAVQRDFVLLTTLGCALLPALRLMTGGPGWLDALQAQQSIIVTLDLLLLTTAGLYLWAQRGRLFGTRTDGEPSPLSLRVPGG